MLFHRSMLKFSQSVLPEKSATVTLNTARGNLLFDVISHAVSKDSFQLWQIKCSVILRG